MTTQLTGHTTPPSRTNPIFPATPAYPATAPILAQPLPPTLDDPPGVAAAHGEAAGGARPGAAAAVRGDVWRVRGVADGRE